MKARKLNVKKTVIFFITKVAHIFHFLITLEFSKFNIVYGLPSKTTLFLKFRIGYQAFHCISIVFPILLEINRK